MKAKEFFKRFRWSVVFPTVLAFAAAIAVMAFPEKSYLARSVTVGVFFVLAGSVSVAAFFLDADSNPVRLLAGVCRLSAALWMFITVNTPLYIFCIAMAAIIMLSAGADIFDAFRHDGGKRRYIRLVCSVLLVAAAVVSCCDPFATQGALLLYTGAVMLAETLFSFTVACIVGLFEEEEVLVFRTVKKGQ